MIAVVWQLLLSDIFHLSVPVTTRLLTGLCVWMIYVSDHLLDVRRGLLYSSRHAFVARNRRALVPILAFALALAAALCFFLPWRIFIAGLGLSLAVLLYLAIVHRGRRLKRVLPKEVMVALLFASGTSIVVWSDPQQIKSGVAALVVFAGLCLVNCVAVDTWEWQSVADRPHPPHTVTRWLGRQFLPLLVLLLLFTLISLRDHPSLAAATVISLVSLLMVAQWRHRFSPEIVRLLADVALLVGPVVLLLVSR